METFIVFGSITAIVLFLSSRRHEERMALINKGINPNKTSEPHTKQQSLKSLFMGLLATGLGLAIAMGAFITGCGFNDGMMTFAIMLLFSGGAMLIFWKMTITNNKNLPELNE